MMRLQATEDQTLQFIPGAIFSIREITLFWALQILNSSIGTKIHFTHPKSSMTPKLAMEKRRVDDGETRFVLFTQGKKKLGKGHN